MKTCWYYMSSHIQDLTIHRLRHRLFFNTHLWRFQPDQHTEHQLHIPDGSNTNSFFRRLLVSCTARSQIRSHYSLFPLQEMGFSCNQTRIFEKPAAHQNIQADGRSRDPHERLLNDPICHPTLHNRTPRLHQQRED